MRIVLVEWLDAFSVHEETDIGEWPESCIIRTVGFHLGADGKYLRIAQEAKPDDVYQCTTHIPLGCVISVETLRNG